MSRRPLGACLLAGLIASTLEAAEPARPTLAELDRDPLLVRAIMLRLARAPDHHVRFATSGAASSNVDYEQRAGGQWFVEDQRYAGDLIEAGLIAGNAEVVQLGTKLLDWAFARQQPDGSFAGTGDPFHSTSLFVEAAARAILFARESDAPEGRSLNERYAKRTIAAARWMIQPKVFHRGEKNNRPYTHRRWIVAAALGMAGELAHDTELASAAADSARDGLSLQQPDGVNPEKDGFDVSYQAVGLVMAARYYTVCRDTGLRARIREMLSRGLAWELGKIDAEGEVSAEGSTRIAQELSRSGKSKTIDFKAVVTALVDGARITGKREFYEAAERVARHVRWIKGEPAAQACR